MVRLHFEISTSTMLFTAFANTFAEDLRELIIRTGWQNCFKGVPGTEERSFSLILRMDRLDTSATCVTSERAWPGLRWALVRFTWMRRRALIKILITEVMTQSLSQTVMIFAFDVMWFDKPLSSLRWPRRMGTLAQGKGCSGWGSKPLCHHGHTSWRQAL